MKRKSKKKFQLMHIFLILLFFTTQAQAQNIRVSGIVVDNKGEALAGVSVKVKDSKVGTIINSAGNFIFKSIAPESELQISFIGFSPQTIPVEGRETLKIVLEETEQMLEEHVVIGYGTQRKEDLTGSIAQVDVADLIKAPVGSFDQAMTGRIAGVSVSTQDGQPGESSHFVIRGGNSLTQSTAPLFVIDGFLMENFDGAAISQQDIESISVLKDASATSIYGARGANGVVVIETKKGVLSRRPTINFSSSFGVQKNMKLMELMSPREFVEYQYELHPTTADRYFLKDHGKTFDDYGDITPYDFQRKLFQTAPIHRNDLSIRGGNQSTKYAISGSVFGQEGIILNSGFKRQTARASISQDVGKKIKTGFIFGVGNSEAKGSPIAQGDNNIRRSDGYLLAQTWAFRPVNVGDKQIDWDSEFVDMDAPFDQMLVNPIQNIRNIYHRNSNLDLNLSAYIAYDINKNLRLKVSLANNTRKGERSFFYNSKTLYGTPLNLNNSRGSWGRIMHSERTSWLNENTLTYKTRIKKHAMNALLGLTAQDTEFYTHQLNAQHVPNEQLGIIGLGEGIPSANQTNRAFNRMFSFLGRVNYTYNQKYMLTSTFRADGSSKFSRKNRWGYFPSLGLAWRLSEESFLKKRKSISNIKLRTSYGLVGNNRITDFLLYPIVVVSESYGYSFGGATPSLGSAVRNIANSDLKWESTEQIDFGLDLGLFRDRFIMEIDVYRKNTHDLLLNAPLPRHVGFLTMVQNIGAIRNQGIEFSIKGTPIKTKLFVWESTFNIAFNKTMIIKFVNDESIMRTNVNWSSFYNNPLYFAKEGGPAALFYGYIHEGNYQYDDFHEISPGKYLLKGNLPNNGNNRTKIQPGDIKYRDLNGDGVIDEADMSIIGDPTPIHFGGFNNVFTYGNISLSVFLQWSYGNDVFNANRTMFEGNALQRVNVNQFKTVVNRWRPENQVNDIPRAAGNGPVGFYDSRTVEDASFLRVKTVVLNYNLPKKICSKMKLKNIGFNLAAQNLFTFTSYKGMDPEISTRNSALTPGFDYAAYPRARTVTFGVKVNY